MPPPTVSASATAVERRRGVHEAVVPGIELPAELPITDRAEELRTAIAEHQVVIVAGETGSGKSTQLPKLCLQLGRGVTGLIGHTQPRRVAARSIAERVAEELSSPLGDAVGYSVRFHDRVGDGTLVRVMTDGILLAELPRDRHLRRYDTLIIDEAHERSLNIDFLLGYLRQLLPRRPDLKVIVTSATIDTARFARHFAHDGVDASIIEVTGRTYPVAIRYQPFGGAPGAPDGDDRDQVQAVVDAVDELAVESPGDVLVFLSGEREIHDTADALRAAGLPHTEVLPLYARLSAAEQHRIFQPHRGRRIVLSTNVAETSLTVPGIRYVVDTGTARISRYSRRLKVQRLPIEPISQASADQRAGRCGRVASGICVRLYGEDDFAARPRYTAPEILRTSLASVILQMTALGLGDVARFPFVEAPDSSAVRDGYALLAELRAIEDPDRRGRRPLTAVGHRLARLPVDPRLGRMVIEAERHGCVREVLVIAAALSIQDPRERPEARRQQADDAHRRFEVPGSDLLTLVALWDYLRAEQRARSSNQFRKLCQTEFLHYLRVREWQDVFSQLRQVAGELGIRAGTEAGHPDRVHQAVLAGLLSHLGQRDGDRRDYRGARGSSFVIAPGSGLARRPPPWVMAAELVETSRLFARRVAAIDPAWAEELGAHLVSRSFGEPRWDARAGRSVTGETVTLYGLPIVSDRTIGYDRVDPSIARELFIRHALVAGDWESRHRFAEHNRRFAADIEALEARVRRRNLLDEEDLFAFFDQRVPSDVVSGRHFDGWWRDEVHDRPGLLDLDVEQLRDRSGAAVQLADYPETWRTGNVEIPLTYRFEPGHPLDGVTAHVPLTALNQLADPGFDWNVAGYRGDLVDALVRTLPKDVRRRLIPAAETVAAVAAVLPATPDGPLVDAVATAVQTVSGVIVSGRDVRLDAVPGWLRMHLAVVDDDGTVLDAGSDLGAIRARLAVVTREAIAAVAPLPERRDLTDWTAADLGAIPPVVEARRAGHDVVGYPALLDDDDRVSLRVLTNADLQQRVHRGGVRRLLLLTAAPSPVAARRGLDNAARLAIAAGGMDADVLAAESVVAAVDRVLDDHDLPWDAAAFDAIRRDVRARAPGVAADAVAAAADVLGAAGRVAVLLDRLVAPAAAPTVEDGRAHITRLTGAGFVLRAGARRLPDVHRYVRGLENRLERAADDLVRDRRRMADIQPLEERFVRHLRRQGQVMAAGAEAVEVGWLLEELRMSVFAQPLGVHGTVSARRINKALDALGAPR